MGWEGLVGFYSLKSPILALFIMNTAAGAGEWIGSTNSLSKHRDQLQLTVSLASCAVISVVV
jgi:hypothetical protein